MRVAFAYIAILMGCCFSTVTEMFGKRANLHPVKIYRLKILIPYLYHTTDIDLLWAVSVILPDDELNVAMDIIMYLHGEIDEDNTSLVDKPLANRIKLEVFRQIGI